MNGCIFESIPGASPIHNFSEYRLLSLGTDYERVQKMTTEIDTGSGSDSCFTPSNVSHRKKLAASQSIVYTLYSLYPLTALCPTEAWLMGSWSRPRRWATDERKMQQLAAEPGGASQIRFLFR
jgi:hypothetical protein